MRREGRSRYVVLAALSLLYFLLTASTFNSLGQVLPFMVKDLGLSWAQAGFGFTLLGLACGLASLAPAALIRLAGIGPTLGFGTLLLATGFAAFARTGGPVGYHVGAVLLGIGFCCCGPVPAVHILSGSFAHRSRALGAYFTIGGLGAVAGPLFVYAMRQEDGGWRGYWLACAVVSLALGGFAALVTRDPARDAPAEAGGEPGAADGWTLRGAFATPQLWIVIAAYTGCLLVNTTVHSFAFQHLIEQGQDQATATGLISVSALIGALGSALAGALGERADGRRLTMLALGMLGLAAASLAIGGGWLALGLFVIGLGVGLGVSYVGTAMLLQDCFGRLANLELYSVMTVVSTSAALGPALGGLVRDRVGGFAGVFVAIAVIACALMLVVAGVRRPEPVRRLATSGS